MAGTGKKLLGVAALLLVAGTLVGFYVATLADSGTPTYAPPARAGARPVVDLTLQTVAAIGPTLSDHPDWVSYLVRENGTWKRSTVWRLPAHATVHVTLYNFDGASGLRNPFLAQVQGIDGNAMTVDGKRTRVLPPDDASHTFAVPQLGVLVPIAPIPDDAKNPCDFAPCALSNDHRTIRFTFHTGAKGHFRWQCLVPCAAGWIAGFGGPMQTIGYMDGFIEVV